MRRHLLLLTFTLILSHFSISNLWGADYLIPVTPGTNCYDGSKNVTEYNRRKIYIGSNGNWADLYFLCPTAATYEVFAGFLTPNEGQLWLYLNNQDAGWHPLDGHHGWNVVDERTCGNRGFNAGSNKIRLCYANAGYNATYIRLHNNDAQSTKTVPTSLDFYWTSKQENGDGAKVILNSDFMYDQKGEDYIKKTTQGGVNYSIFNANTTASSRDLVCFPNTGTYQFTFHVYASETNSDYQIPYVFVNSFIAGGGTFSLSDGSTKDIVVEMDVTAGTYPIAFYIPYSNHADRYHLSTVSIAQKVSCTAPNHVDISGNYHFFPGETISLTATAYSSAGTESPIDDEDITGYQWQKNVAGEYTNIEGANSATYTKANATTSDVGQYKCIVSTGATCSTQSGVFDVKCLQLYLYYNNKSDKYNLPFTKVDDTHATASVLLDNSSYTYYYKITDGCNDWWGNNGTMNSGNCTGWSLNVNDHCGLTTTKSATYQFNLTYNAALNSFSMSVVYPSTVQTGGYNIYFDNSFTNWTTSKIYYRIGRSNYNSKAQMTLVPGTAHLYTTTTIHYENDGGFEAWHIANNGCWSGGNSIYKTNTGDTWAATQAMRFEGSPVSSSGITIVPVDEHWTGTGDASNCEFYSYGSSSGLLTHTATISDISNGSVRLNWTDIDDEAQNATTTTSGLAHTCNLQVTALPATGYETATLTVNGSNFTSGNTHVLSADASIAATFSPKSCTVNFDKEGGSDGSNNVTATYDAAMPDITAPTKTGYTFGGYWDGDNGTGTQYYNADGTSARTWDKNTTSETPLYAKWTAKTTTVSFDQNSGSGGQTSSLTATYGSAMPTPITTPTRTGYDFEGYCDGVGGAGTKYYNNNGTSARNWDKEDATWTLSAKWTAKDYTVTYSNPGNSNSYTISVDGGSAGSENKTAHYGNTITLTASAYTGYAFSSWTIKKTSDNSDVTASVSLSGNTGSDTFIMPDYGVTVTATFIFDAHTLPCDLGFYYTSTGGEGGKEILNSDFSYSCNTDYAKNNQHSPYQEVCFSGSGPYTLTSRKSVTFPTTGKYVFTFPLYIKDHGNYDAPRVTVNGSQTTANIISTATDNVSQNYVVELDVTAGTYPVSVWIGNTNEKVFFSTLNIAAKAAATTYAVTVNVNDEDYGSAEANKDEYEADATVTLTATPGIGYAFSSWTITKDEDDSDVTSSVSLSEQTKNATFTMPDYDVTVTANFVARAVITTPTVEAESGIYEDPINISLEATSYQYSHPVVVFFVSDGTTTYEVTGAPYGSAGNSLGSIGAAGVDYQTVHKATFTATKAATYTVIAKLYEGELVDNFETENFRTWGDDNAGTGGAVTYEDNSSKTAVNGSNQVLKIYCASDAADWGGAVLRFIAKEERCLGKNYDYLHVRMKDATSNSKLKISDSDGSTDDIAPSLGSEAGAWKNVTYARGERCKFDFLLFMINRGGSGGGTVYIDDVILSNESSMTIKATSSSASVAIAKVFTGDGADANWNTTANWSDGAVSTINDVVYIRKPAVINVTNAKAKSIILDQSSSYTGSIEIQSGKELVIATTLKKTTDGSAMIATGVNDVFINSDASNGLGALVMGTHDGTNKATVNFYTLSHGSSGSDLSVNQYVGTPFNDETNILYNWYNSWVYGIVYDGSGNIGWGRVNEGQGMTPFKGYTVISADPAGHSYWQQGTLNATTNQTISGLNWQSGSGAANENNENLLANSWMAPIKIAAMQSTDFVRTDATIYIFNSTSPNDYKLGGFASNYTTYTVGTAGTTDIIPAMQSFSVFTNASGGSSVTLDYSKIVYDPAVAGTVPAANRAPQRRKSAEEANKLRLFVSAESGYGDMVYMWERSDFAEGFENGWDGRKVFGEPVAPQLYAVTPDGNMAVNCVPDFEGTLLGFQAGTSANSYTFTFEYTDEAEELYLRDMDTNAFTRVMNGNSYTFTTSDRTSHNRFVLTKNAPQSPTDIAETGDGLPVTGARKVIINDHVYILRGGRMYSIEGRVVKSE